jgi:hypothetical protein
MEIKGKGNERAGEEKRGRNRKGEAEREKREGNLERETKGVECF